MQYQPKPSRWSALNERTDEQLAGLFLQGTQDALAVLFDRYCRLTFSIAVRIVKDEAEAEDVVQNVFLDLSRALGNFDPLKGTFRIWLLQYAYHRALHRKRHLVANRFYSWVALDDAPHEATAPLASEALERTQLLERLLERTTPQRRKILELTYCEGLTANEVALTIGLSVNVVRHELYRALAELKKLTSNKSLPALLTKSHELLGNQRTNAHTV